MTPMPPAPSGFDPTLWSDLWRLQFHPHPYEGPQGERLAGQMMTALLELDADTELPASVEEVREGLRANLRNHGVIPGGPA